MNYNPFQQNFQKPDLINNQSHASIKETSDQEKLNPIIERLQKQYGKKVIQVGPNQFKVLDEPYVQRS